MEDFTVPGFSTKSLHVHRNLLIAGTSHIPVADVKENWIEDNVCGACYIVAGTGESDDGKGHKYPFYPGCFIQWPPLYPHYRRIFSGIYVDKYFVMPPECYDMLKRMNLVSLEHPVVNLGVDPKIGRRYDEIAHELQAQTELNLPSTLNKAFSFVTELLLPRPAENPEKKRLMEQAAELLEKDFQDKIAIPELAFELKMSYTNFRRTFGDFYHMSPLEYRIRKKIEKIQSILSVSKPCMKELCQQFGFADVYTFSKQFKKYTGFSPRDFRAGI